MSFWKDNPFAPTWKSAIKNSLFSSAVDRLVKQPMTLKGRKGCVGILFQIADPSQSEILCQFWSTWFRSSTRCRFQYPVQVLKGLLEKGLLRCIVAWDTTVHPPRLVGTVAERVLGEGWIYGTRFDAVKCIDFFCVHGAWRKRGLGSALLHEIHADSTRRHAPQGVPPYLFLYEGVQLAIPPLAVSRLLAWRRGAGTVGEVTLGVKEVAIGEAQVEEKIRRQCGVFVRGPWVESKLLQISTQVICIQNTYTTSIPEGYTIGLVVFSEATLTEEIMNTISRFTGYRILLFPSSIAHVVECEGDSVVEWIGYNVKGGLPGTQYPVVLS